MLDPAYLRYREDFAETLDPRTHNIDWLDAQVFAGFIRVWPAHDACLLTSIRQFPTGAFEVHVEIAAGNRETLVGNVIKRVEAWAEEIGALFVTISSREGWARVMKPHGYDVFQVALRKEIR